MYRLIAFIAMKSVIFKTRVAVANGSGAMEVETISRHRRSSKSHMSRGNFLSFLGMVAITLSIAVVTSCKKDNDKTDDDGSTVKLVETIKYKSYPDDKFEYDEQNRIIKSYLGVDPNTQTFKYEGDDLVEVVYEKIYEDIHIVRTYECKRNGNTITIKNDNNEGIITVTLNNEGFPVSIKSEYKITNFTIQNGNIVTQTEKYENFSGEGEDIVHYNYKYDNKKSPFFFCKSPMWAWHTFRSLTPLIMFNGSKNNMTGVGEYEDIIEYVYDNDGFPTKLTFGDEEFNEEIEFKYKNID